MNTKRRIDQLAKRAGHMIPADERPVVFVRYPGDDLPPELPAGSLIVNLAWEDRIMQDDHTAQD